MLCVPEVKLDTLIVVEPLVSVPVPSTALLLLASSRLTDSPFVGEPLTETVKLTGSPRPDGFGPLSVSVVVVAVLIV